MADLKLEDAVVENAIRSGVDQSSAGMNMYKRLKIALKYVCLMYDIQIQMLPGPAEQSSEDINESVHAVVCNQPCNTPTIAEISN